MTNRAPSARSGAVFVVDDDAAVRDSLKTLLEAENLTADEFASGAELLTQMRGRRRPACLIMDMHMPGMNGLELLDELRRCGVTAPAIMITGNASPTLRESADQRGVVAVLEKPFVDGELIGLIRRALTSHVP